MTQGPANGENAAPLFDVTSEVVLITGASQGLGRRFAKLLAGRGGGRPLCLLRARPAN